MSLSFGVFITSINRHVHARVINNFSFLKYFEKINRCPSVHSNSNTTRAEIVVPLHNLIMKVYITISTLDVFKFG
jgi:hypothetical protein